MREERGEYFGEKRQQEPRHGGGKTKQTPSSNDRELSLLVVGQNIFLESQHAVRNTILREAEGSLPSASNWCQISRKVT